MATMGRYFDQYADAEEFQNAKKAGNTSAAGSQASAPAKGQDLLAMPNANQYDSIYSSDYAPPVVSTPPAYSPPAPVMNTSPVGPSNSQTPSVTTSSNVSSNQNLNTSTKNGMAAAPTESASTFSTPVSTTSTQTASPYSGDPTSMSAFTSMPTIDDYISQMLGGTPNGRMTNTGVDLSQVMRERPDVYNDFYAAYNDPSRNDKNSSAWTNRVGGDTPFDYANYWWNNGGANEWANMSHTPAPSGGTGGGTGGTGGDPNTNPGPGTGLGNGGTTGNTSADKLAALNQAIARAKLATQGRGLNWDNYQGLFNSFYQDIYNSIPDTDTNPNSWFDPNAANVILAGEENKARAGYRQQAMGLPTSIDPHMLDSTIASILGDSSSQAQQMLQNGMTRGQFNAQGYEGGQAALTKALEAAKAKLYGYGGDFLNNYNMQLSQIRNNAMNYAGSYQLGDNFDLSPFSSQAQQLMEMAQQMGSGQLYSLLGDQPLINLGDMRMAAGTAQGAINLNDLDVLDALSKRHSIDQMGRGIGSQGSF